MRVVLINTDINENSRASDLLLIMKRVLEADGVNADMIRPAAGNIHACTGCGKCQKTGKCMFEDGMVNVVLSQADRIDALIFAGASLYGKPGKQMRNFTDRLFRSAPGRFAGKPAVILICVRKGNTPVNTDRLCRHLSVNHMPYFQMISYINKDDNDDHTAAETAEALIWLMKCIGEGKKKGIECIYTEENDNFFSR